MGRYRMEKATVWETVGQIWLFPSLLDLRWTRGTAGMLFLKQEQPI